MDRILTVQYKYSQGAEDLYWCPETKKMYVRQSANVEEIVFWLTSVKWSGGYEADCHIRAGITMRVVDKYENILFEEILEKDDWNSGTSAKKTGPFANEAIIKMASELGVGLLDRESWRKWLIEDKEKYGNNDYDDNWLYYESNITKVNIIEEKWYLGKQAFFAELKAEHRISDKKWSEFVVLSDDKSSVLRIAGYKLG